MRAVELSGIEEEQIFQDIICNRLSADLIRSNSVWEKARSARQKKGGLIDLQTWIEVCRERERLFIKRTGNLF